MMATVPSSQTGPEKLRQKSYTGEFKFSVVKCYTSSLHSADMSLRSIDTTSPRVKLHTLL